MALTKTDLVPASRHRAVSAEIRAALSGTRRAGIELMPVSSTTGDGIAALRERLMQEASAVPPKSRPAGGRFRLAVDRCFSLPGVGTVVTGAVLSGAVLSGAVAIGDRVVVSPSGLMARVRSIHAQSRAAVVGRAGERCALNLAGDSVRHVLHLATAMGRVEEAAHDHFFLTETMGEIVRIVRTLGTASPDGFFTAADLRDRLNNGRKVAIQILECLDRRGVTLRHGDRRQVAPPR